MVDTAFGLTVPNYICTYLPFQITPLYLIFVWGWMYALYVSVEIVHTYSIVNDMLFDLFRFVFYFQLCFGSPRRSLLCAGQV